MRNSAENLAVVSLELGGKSPIVVLDDADLDNAVNGIVAANFGATGQSCVAGTRVYVQRRVYDEVAHRLVDRAQRIVVGDPMAHKTEIGPLATAAQVVGIEDALTRSLDEGAEVLTGGRVPESQPRGSWYEPTVLSCPPATLAERCGSPNAFRPASCT